MSTTFLQYIHVVHVHTCAFGDWATAFSSSPSLISLGGVVFCDLSNSSIKIASERDARLLAIVVT